MMHIMNAQLVLPVEPIAWSLLTRGTWNRTRGAAAYPAQHS